jgi:hypothetical protein
MCCCVLRGASNPEMQRYMRRTSTQQHCFFAKRADICQAGAIRTLLHLSAPQVGAHLAPRLLFVPAQLSAKRHARMVQFATPLGARYASTHTRHMNIQHQCTDLPGSIDALVCRCSFRGATATPHTKHSPRSGGVVESRQERLATTEGGAVYRTKTGSKRSGNRASAHMRRWGCCGAAVYTQFETSICRMRMCGSSMVSLWHRIK